MIRTTPSPSFCTAISCSPPKYSLSVCLTLLHTYYFSYSCFCISDVSFCKALPCPELLSLPSGCNPSTLPLFGIPKPSTGQLHHIFVPIDIFRCLCSWMECGGSRGGETNSHFPFSRVLHEFYYF